MTVVVSTILVGARAEQFTVAKSRRPDGLSAEVQSRPSVQKQGLTTGVPKPLGMTVEVERAFDVDAPIEAVWDLLSNDETRAQTISVVEEYELRDRGNRSEVIWSLSLPIPLVSSTIAVRTRDVERDPPNYVKFVGKSKVMTVTGEHELSETDSGCHVINRFIVDGKVPGVEKFFERNIDDEIENFRLAILDHVRDIEEV